MLGIFHEFKGLIEIKEDISFDSAEGRRLDKFDSVFKGVGLILEKTNTENKGYDFNSNTKNLQITIENNFLSLKDGSKYLVLYKGFKYSVLEFKKISNLTSITATRDF